MRTRASARPGGNTHAPLYAGESAADSRAHTCRHFASAAMVISYAAFARSDHNNESDGGRSGLGLGEKLTQKREAPAVVGPGLSCRGFTTILADRDVGT